MYITSTRNIHRGQKIPKLTKLLISIKWKIAMMLDKENQTPPFITGCQMIDLQLMSQVLPPQIATYGTFRPKGYLTRFQQWPIYPNSSNQYWANDDIVRFLITISQGVMDPYRSHFQFTVVTDSQTMPVGQLQVDSSAQSFISQSVVSSMNTQIQRITQYDSLACYLTDVGFSQYVCQSRDDQGLGYSQGVSNQPFCFANRNTSTVIYDPEGSQETRGYTVSSQTVMPTTTNIFSGRGNQFALGKFGFNNQQIIGTSSVQTAPSNILAGGKNTPQYVGRLDSMKRVLGRFGNVRSEYTTSILGRGYIDTNESVLQTCPIVKNQTWTLQQMTTLNQRSGYNPKAPYQIYFQPENQWFNAATVKVEKAPSICSINGYQKPICSQFSRGCNQTIISPTVPQAQMVNGKIIPFAIPVAKKKFRVPFISAIIGLLIPPDQFLLIPIQALNGLLIQITLSRFAMFTSGYSDVHEFDRRGMQNMQRRNWKLSQISYNLHMYSFGNQQVNKILTASLTKEIPVSVTSYTLASQYQLPNGQTVRNGWPVNFQAQSVCQVIAFFLSNDYQTHSFCRKQFRLSNNITSYQLKFNTQYFPTQPIIGNAGNPQTVDETGDNYPFYQQILLSNNYLFNTNFPLPKINPKNFAINERCYDIKNTATFYDTNMWLNPNYQWHEKSINADTAMGMPSFHQNRFRGTAAYSWSFQPYGHSKNLMTGINTYGATNFILQLNNSPYNPYPRDQTLLIYVRYNTMTIFTPNGIKVVGR